MKNLEGADLVEAMIEEIEKHGWTQRVLQSDDGKLCLMGAGIKAGIKACRSSLNGWTGWDEVDGRPHELFSVIGKALGFHPHQISRFNDLELKSQEEAISFLETRAKELRNASR